MRIVWFLPSEPLELFMVEEGLHPQMVVHSQGLKSLGQREVCNNHIMDLNHVELVFNQTECQGCSLRLTGTSGLVGKGGVKGVFEAFRG